MHNGDGVMSTGDSADILDRVKKLLPRRWFAWVAPYRDAVLGGLSDGAASCYNIYLYAKAQSRLSTSSGPFLDLIAYDFLGRYLRRGGMNDSTFLARIKATILQERVTRKGMVSAITALVGTAPVIFEPWNTGDTGGYDVGGVGYDTAGGWGSTDLPAQVFIQVHLPGYGVPNVAGFDTGAGGYDAGGLEYIGDATSLTGVTPSDIYDTIETTKPTGVTCWTALI
jgi:hypothetical protein